MKSREAVIKLIHEKFSQLTKEEIKRIAESIKRVRHIKKKKHD